jgi:two-component system sensor histidine kinase BaeS
MRLKLVHQLSLLLAGAALLAVVAVSLVVSWNLRTGFTDYLRAKDAAQLDRLAQIIKARSSADPELTWLRGSRESMESLLTEFRGFERPNPRFTPRPPPPPDSIEGWIQIYNPHGDWLAGRPQAGSPSTVRLVQIQGTSIAEIRLYRSNQPSSVDAAFLMRQYLGLGLAGAAALLVSLIIGWLVARRWVRPLKALQLTTHRIAAGDLSIRTEPTGAQEIAQLMTDVNAMTASLDGLQKARKLWIAQISHELRTPLSVLRGELEAVQDGARKPDDALIQNLLDEVLHLGRLVGDLHTLSMADVGQLHCEFQTQDVHPELLRITNRYAAIAESRGLILQQDFQTDSVIATWDMRRIIQVLTNLLENSLRYTDAPGRIDIQWQVKRGIFSLLLEDSAPSVQGHSLDQMFEPLYRADTARTRKPNDDAGGSGLGLAIVRVIVQAHQGSIHASQSQLGGIKITLTLPLNPMESA